MQSDLKNKFFDICFARLALNTDKSNVVIFSKYLEAPSSNLMLSGTTLNCKDEISDLSSILDAKFNFQNLLAL